MPAYVQEPPFKTLTKRCTHTHTHTHAHTLIPSRIHARRSAIRGNTLECVRTVLEAMDTLKIECADEEVKAVSSLCTLAASVWSYHPLMLRPRPQTREHAPTSNKTRTYSLTHTHSSHPPPQLKDKMIELDSNATFDYALVAELRKLHGDSGFQEALRRQGG